MDELTSITLSEKNQAKKAMYCIMPFIWDVQDKQMCRNRNYINGFQGLGMSVQGMTTIEFLFEVMKMSKIYHSDGNIIMNILKSNLSG